VLPAVPPEALLAWTASADVMVMAIQPNTTNHRFTTPQKLWEAIASGVPVVASDLPGMAAVVTETGVGVLCDPTSPASIAAGLRRVLEAGPEDRAALRRHVLEVGHDRYTWDAQAAKLLDLYASLAGRR
jgi:glycosyltransferase involved in cell wall biosynthesis